MVYILWASFLVATGAIAMEMNNLPADQEQHRYRVLLLRLNALEEENCALFARSYVEKWAEIKADISALTEPAQKATIARRLSKEADRACRLVCPICCFGGSTLVMPFLNTTSLAATVPGMLSANPTGRAILASFWAIGLALNWGIGIHDFWRERVAMRNLWAAATEMRTEAAHLLPDEYDSLNSDSV